VDRPRDSTAAGGGADAPTARREWPPSSSSSSPYRHGDEPWPAGGSGGGGAWQRPPVRAEEEHAAIVAALAHVIGAGRRGYDSGWGGAAEAHVGVVEPPAAALGHQGNCLCGAWRARLELATWLP
jgi:hypothetical protein